MIAYLKSKCVKLFKAKETEIEFTDEYNEWAMRKNLKMDYFSVIMQYCRDSKDEILNSLYVSVQERIKIHKSGYAFNHEKHIESIEQLVIVNKEEKCNLDICDIEYYNIRFLIKTYNELNDNISKEGIIQLRKALNDSVRWLKNDPVGTIYCW
jgi:hypothetical protein